jgi:hypothetical protein
MLAPDRSFPNGSPVCEYWLSRCEGFTVRAGHRILGIVETVEHYAGGGSADRLVLRKPHRRRRALATDEVLAVVPARKVLIARRHEHAKPAVVRVRAGVAAAMPVVVASARTVAAALLGLALWVTRTLRREVPRLTRIALAEIHDRNVHHGEEPGVGRAHRRANEYDYRLSTRGR